VPSDVPRWEARRCAWAEKAEWLSMVRAINITGEFQWVSSPFTLAVSQFGEVLFGHARTTIGARTAIVVAKLSDIDNISGLATRLYSKPLA
jgi:hypothetical protein